VLHGGGEVEGGGGPAQLGRRQLASKSPGVVATGGQWL
jgi:hypothetical protein